MHNIFYCDIQKINEASLINEYQFLPRIYREKIDKIKEDTRRKETLAGLFLARRSIASLFNTAPEKIEFDYGAHNKPFVVNMGVHFNISHAGDKVFVAVSDAPIGLDCEQIRDFSPAMAQKQFEPEEIKYISDAGEDKSLMQARFYQIYCAKQAYLKYLGVCSLEGINPLRLQFENGVLQPSEQDVYLKFDTGIEGYVAAMVTGKI